MQVTPEAVRLLSTTTTAPECTSETLSLSSHPAGHLLKPVTDHQVLAEDLLGIPMVQHTVQGILMPSPQKVGCDIEKPRPHPSSSRLPTASIEIKQAL